MFFHNNKRKLVLLLKPYKDKKILKITLNLEKSIYIIQHYMPDERQGHKCIKMQCFKEIKQNSIWHWGLQIYTIPSQKHHYQISKAFIINIETRFAFKVANLHLLLHTQCIYL